MLTKFWSDPTPSSVHLFIVIIYEGSTHAPNSLVNDDSASLVAIRKTRTRACLNSLVIVNIKYA